MRSLAEVSDSREAPAAPIPVDVMDLGRRPYLEVLELQRSVARERREGTRSRDALLLVEHEPVITLGRGSDAAHVTADADWLASRGIDLVEIERGGDVTYHGPGQLVGYPILDLHDYRLDLHWYLRRLEQVLLTTVAGLGLPAFRVEGYTGAWTGTPPEAVLAAVEGDGFETVTGDTVSALLSAGTIRKVGSIGVHASRWVTWHGFALNVTEEPLAAFPSIVPCGIEHVQMTSLVAEGVEIGLRHAKEGVLRAFEAAFPQTTTSRSAAE